MRAARPLAPSEGMRRVLRLLAVVREAAAASGETDVVVDATPTGPGTLDVGALSSIEAELGTELHDDVLTVFAARIPMLTTATGLVIDDVLDRVGEADAPDGWVSIGWVSEDPFEARRSHGEHGGGLGDLFVPAPPRTASVIAPVRNFDAPLPFPRWVEDQLRIELGRRSDWLELLGRVAAVTEVPTFALSGATPAGPRVAARRVIHDKFGEGTVIRTLAGDKLVIAFADGERTLLARFVRDM
jgi:hypothetical protein